MRDLFNIEAAKKQCYYLNASSDKVIVNHFKATFKPPYPNSPPSGSTTVGRYLCRTVISAHPIGMVDGSRMLLRAKSRQVNGWNVRLI